MTQGNNGEQAIFYHADALVPLPLHCGQQGELEGTESAARAINDAGMVVGSVRSRAEEQGRPNTRAAAWEPDESTHVLTELRAEFGCNAVAANDCGQVLIMAGVGVFDVRSILWRPVNNAWSYVGNGTTNVYPIALTDDGIVLGQARNNRAESRRRHLPSRRPLGAPRDRGRLGSDRYGANPGNVVRLGLGRWPATAMAAPAHRPDHLAPLCH